MPRWILAFGMAFGLLSVGRTVAASPATPVDSAGEEPNRFPLKTTVELLAESEDYQVWSDGFARCSECTDQPIVLLLRVEDRRHNETQRLRLDEGFESHPLGPRITASIVGDRGVLIGSQHGGWSIAVVLQLAPPLRVIERRVCREATVSHGGTRVACGSPIPLHVHVPARVVLNVLDLLANPVRWVVVYPQDNAAHQDADPIVYGPEPKDPGKGLGSSWSWSPDDSRVAFVESNTTGYALVEIDLRRGLHAPRVFQGRTFDEPSLTGLPQQSIDVGFRAGDIAWFAGSRLRVTLPQTYPRCEAFFVTLPSVDRTARPLCVARPTPTVRGLPTRPLEPDVRVLTPSPNIGPKP